MEGVGDFCAAEGHHAVLDLDPTGAADRSAEREASRAVEGQGSVVDHVARNRAGGRVIAELEGHHAADRRTTRIIVGAEERQLSVGCAVHGQGAGSRDLPVESVAGRVVDGEVRHAGEVDRGAAGRVREVHDRLVVVDVEGGPHAEVQGGIRGIGARSSIRKRGIRADSRCPAIGIVSAKSYR